MKLRMALLIILALTLLAPISPGDAAADENLDNYRGCPMQGSASSQCTQDQNRLKNRWRRAPSNNEINYEVTLAAVLQQGEDSDRWSNDDGAEITGYVASVDDTGGESCNCDSEAEGETDFHINVVTGSSVHSDCSRMIVEITPRWQHINHWTFDQVKQEIEHKWVTFRGWMFSDIYHMREALNTRRSDAFKCGGKNGPFNCNGTSGRKLWRRTIWELHPVTSYTVLSGPPH